MALSQLINFLSGARRLAKLDPTTAFPNEAPEQAQCHRMLVRAGKAGAVVGEFFGLNGPSRDRILDTARFLRRMEAAESEPAS